MTLDNIGEDDPDDLSNRRERRTDLFVDTASEAPHMGGSSLEHLDPMNLGTPVSLLPAQRNQLYDEPSFDGAASAVPASVQPKKAAPTYASVADARGEASSEEPASAAFDPATAVGLDGRPLYSVPNRARPEATMVSIVDPDGIPPLPSGYLDVEPEQSVYTVLDFTRDPTAYPGPVVPAGANVLYSAVDSDRTAALAARSTNGSVPTFVAPPPPPASALPTAGARRQAPLPPTGAAPLRNSASALLPPTALPPTLPPHHLPHPAAAAVDLGGVGTNLDRDASAALALEESGLYTSHL